MADQLRAWDGAHQAAYQHGEANQNLYAEGKKDIYTNGYQETAKNPYPYGHQDARAGQTNENRYAKTETDQDNDAYSNQGAALLPLVLVVDLQIEGLR